ncbi:hypothetical protein BCR39DRAFT_551903 [Naematelia encephala]|uniref:Uncharacterized protein n=1 Tax=Naematelia encephala TaxID=71784 RepID=A0A1Y2AI20_9TREE|nr:hypothetical protein BCR39DRAFT_551903 [Naematelia encephala]
MSEDLFNVLHSMPSFNGSDVSIFNFPRLTIDVVRAARAQANPSLSSTVSVEQSRDLRHSNHEISTRAQQGSSDVTPDTGSVAAQFHPRSEFQSCKRLWVIRYPSSYIFLPETAGHDPNTISLIVSSSSMLNSPEGNIRSSQSQSSEEGSSRRATHIQDDSHRSPVWSLQIHSDEKGENSAVDRTIEWRHPDVEAHQGLSIDRKFLDLDLRYGSPNSFSGAYNPYSFDSSSDFCPA